MINTKHSVQCRSNSRDQTDVLRTDIYQVELRGAAELKIIPIVSYEFDNRIQRTYQYTSYPTSNPSQAHQRALSIKRIESSVFLEKTQPFRHALRCIRLSHSSIRVMPEVSFTGARTHRKLVSAQIPPRCTRFRARRRKIIGKKEKKRLTAPSFMILTQSICPHSDNFSIRSYRLRIVRADVCIHPLSRS